MVYRSIEHEVYLGAAVARSNGLSSPATVNCPAYSGCIYDNLIKPSILNSLNLDDKVIM